MSKAPFSSVENTFGELSQMDGNFVHIYFVICKLLRNFNCRQIATEADRSRTGCHQWT